MQTVIQVMCSGKKSLRAVIEKDGQIEKYRLQLAYSKRNDRSSGWAKLKSMEANIPGAINFEWESSSQTLTCRVVTKTRNKPDQIIGDFIAYLMGRHSRRIVTVLISQLK